MATHCPPNPPNASKPLEEWAAVTPSFPSARKWADPGAFSERRHITKLYVGVVSLICALACTLYPVEAQPAKEDRIVIGYVAPENPEHMPVFTLLKDNQALERVRDLLAPIRWPRTLRLEIKGCDGEFERLVRRRVDHRLLRVRRRHLEERQLIRTTSRRRAGGCAHRSAHACLPA